MAPINPMTRRNGAGAGRAHWHGRGLQGLGLPGHPARRSAGSRDECQRKTEMLSEVCHRAHRAPNGWRFSVHRAGHLSSWPAGLGCFLMQFKGVLWKHAILLGTLFPACVLFFRLCQREKNN